MKPFIIYPPNPRICPGEDSKCSHIYHAFINYAHQAQAAGEPCCFKEKRCRVSNGAVHYQTKAKMEHALVGMKHTMKRTQCQRTTVKRWRDLNMSGHIHSILWTFTEIIVQENQLNENKSGLQQLHGHQCSSLHQCWTSARDSMGDTADNWYSWPGGHAQLLKSFLLMFQNISGPNYTETSWKLSLE